jgi:hypothetical protein
MIVQASCRRTKALADRRPVVFVFGALRESRSQIKLSTMHAVRVEAAE